MSNIEKVMSVKPVTSKGKGGTGEPKKQFLITTITGAQIWLGLGAFKNATGGNLNHSEFAGGEIAFAYLKKGDKLQDGSEVTDDNKLVDQLTVVITPNEKLAARKAAIIEMMRIEELEDEIAMKKARLNALNTRSTSDGTTEGVAEGVSADGGDEAFGE